MKNYKNWFEIEARDLLKNETVYVKRYYGITKKKALRIHKRAITTARLVVFLANIVSNSWTITLKVYGNLAIRNRKVSNHIDVSFFYYFENKMLDTAEVANEIEGE